MGVLVLTGVSLLLGPLLDGSRRYIFIYACIHILMYINKSRRDICI